MQAKTITIKKDLVILSKRIMQNLNIQISVLSIIRHVLMQPI